MSLIEVQSPQEVSEKVPVTTRDVFIHLMNESNRKGQDLSQPLDTILKHRRDAATYERLANEPTTDEMRHEQFGTPLPDGHPVAPHVSKKIGASALR